jgi:hypothetical protein
LQVVVLYDQYDCVDYFSLGFLFFQKKSAASSEQEKEANGGGCSLRGSLGECKCLKIL